MSKCIRFFGTLSSWKAELAGLGASIDRLLARRLPELCLAEQLNKNFRLLAGGNTVSGMEVGPPPSSTGERLFEAAGAGRAGDVERLLAEGATVAFKAEVSGTRSALRRTDTLVSGAELTALGNDCRVIAFAGWKNGPLCCLSGWSREGCSPSAGPWRRSECQEQGQSAFLSLGQGWQADTSTVASLAHVWLVGSAPNRGLGNREAGFLMA